MRFAGVRGKHPPDTVLLGAFSGRLNSRAPGGEQSGTRFPEPSKVRLKLIGWGGGDGSSRFGLNLCRIPNVIQLCDMVDRVSSPTATIPARLLPDKQQVNR